MIRVLLFLLLGFLDTKHSLDRLMFLDKTLEGMIRRFEDEFPETRLPEVIPSDGGDTSPTEFVQSSFLHADTDLSTTFPPLSDEGEPPYPTALPRRESDISLAVKAQTEEEGRMLRLGQQWRRDVLHRENGDHVEAAKETKETALHLQLLRAMVDGLDGDEIKQRVLAAGPEVILHDTSEEAVELRKQLIEMDPEGWRNMKEAQEAADHNTATAEILMELPVLEIEPVLETAPVPEAVE